MHEIVYIWNINQSPPPKKNNKINFCLLSDCIAPIILHVRDLRYISFCWLSAKKILDVNTCDSYNPPTINIARACQRCWLSAKNITKQHFSQPTTRTIIKQ